MITPTHNTWRQQLCKFTPANHAKSEDQLPSVLEGVPEHDLKLTVMGDLNAKVGLAEEGEERTIHYAEVLGMVEGSGLLSFVLRVAL